MAKMDPGFRYYESRETTHYHVLPAVEMRRFCSDCTDDTVARKCMVYCGIFFRPLLCSAGFESSSTRLDNTAAI